jgi:hypothetical protein
LALGGRRFINIFNNQMELAYGVGDVLRRTQGWGGTCQGACYLFVWGSELIDKKKKKEICRGLRWLPFEM